MVSIDISNVGVVRFSLGIAHDPINQTEHFQLPNFRFVVRMHHKKTLKCSHRSHQLFLQHF
jgi:hypothetical protein